MKKTTKTTTKPVREKKEPLTDSHVESRSGTSMPTTVKPAQELVTDDPKNEIAITGNGLTRTMDTQVSMQMDMDALVLIPMRKFKDECEKTIRTLSAQHADVEQELQRLHADMSAKIIADKESRDEIGKEEIDAFKEAFKAIGCKCSRKGLTHKIDSEKKVVIFELTIEYETKRSNASYYNNNTLTFEKSLTFDQMGLTDIHVQISKKNRLRDRLAKVIGEWRRKYAESKTVEERFRCRLIETQVRKFSGGEEIIRALEAQLMSTELNELETEVVEDDE